jgi:hypothetical protein
MRIDPHAADGILHLVLTDQGAARAAGMMPRSAGARRTKAVVVAFNLSVAMVMLAVVPIDH